jgi:hypothetical protein
MARAYVIKVGAQAGGETLDGVMENSGSFKNPSFPLAPPKTINTQRGYKRNILGGTWVHPRYVNPGRPFQ